jgi:hypothetical protein
MVFITLFFTLGIFFIKNSEKRKKRIGLWMTIISSLIFCLLFYSIIININDFSKLALLSDEDSIVVIEGNYSKQDFSALIKLSHPYIPYGREISNLNWHKVIFKNQNQRFSLMYAMYKGNTLIKLPSKRNFALVVNK